ncbi:MAG TPA: TolC family outer membrane protein [Nevskiales bacterium]|nr:TolC family outer membrane protein [Nevskiales bacterium]
MTLSEALQRASQVDPTVPGSLALYDAEREAGKQERGTRLPSVALTVGYDQANTEATFPFGTAPKEDYHGSSAALAARQPLFRLDWFARGTRAQALDTQAELGLQERKLQLLRRVADRYFGVLVAQDALAQAEAEARAVRESLEDTRKRYEVELVPGTDLKEAQARDDLAQARLLAARRALESARDALDEITGNGRAELPPLAEQVSFPPLTPAGVEAWVAAAGQQSPRIAQARQALVVAEANHRSRQSEAAPSVDLVASISHDDSTDYSLGQERDDRRIGLELNVPLYAGGINASRIREAEARRRIAEAELKRLTLEIERETRQLFRQVQTGYDEARAFEKSLASALAAERATRAGYDAGTRTITDVLDAKSRVVQARRDLNGTRYNLLLSLLQLKQTVGSLSERDFAEIDRLLAAQPPKAPAENPVSSGK